jgi:hypothetical protein
MKLGRPKKPAHERMTEFFNVRLCPDDYRTVCRAIRKSGEDQSAWLRDALLTKAHQGGGSGGGRG